MSADTTPGLEAEQWKCGNELLPYHPQASHVHPEYREGGNHCYAAFQAGRRAPATAQGPTDAELIAFQEEEQYGLYCDPDDFVDIARAVLARWGTPAASGEPVARKPLSADAVRQVLADAGYDRGVSQGQRAAFINGLRHGEVAHGIKP